MKLFFWAFLSNNFQFTSKYARLLCTTAFYTKFWSMWYIHKHSYVLNWIPCTALLFYAWKLFFKFYSILLCKKTHNFGARGKGNLREKLEEKEIEEDLISWDPHPWAWIPRRGGHGLSYLHALQCQRSLVLNYLKTWKIKFQLVVKKEREWRDNLKFKVAKQYYPIDYEVDPCESKQLVVTCRK